MPVAGTDGELLDAPYRSPTLEVTAAAARRAALRVPSNYGQVFVSPPLDL
jgi:hypothetical protein